MLLDQPWVVCLSRELSQQLSNSSSSAEDKVCALPAPSRQHSPGAPSSGAGAEGARSPCGPSSPLPLPSPQRCFPPCCPGSATGGRRGCSLGCWGLSRPGPALTRRAVTTSRSRSLLFQKFLYRALGTVLASCRQLTHVQGQLLKYLKETDATSPCDRQVKFPLLPLLCPASPCPSPAPDPFHFLVAAVSLGQCPALPS